MGNLLFDFRDALRTLRRDRGYSAAIVLTLGLTIGATTAMFAIVNGVLLRPLAYRESHQLVVVREIIPELSHLYPTLPANPRHFVEWQNRATSFEQLTELLPSKKNMTRQGDASQITVVETTGNLFDVLGARPALGRTLRPDDDRMNAELVMVLTDREWRNRFHAEPGVIDRTVALDGKPHTIVGVLAPDFRLLQFDGLGSLVQETNYVDAFVPLRIDPNQFSPIGEFNYAVIARLKPGITARQALSELNVIQADIANSFKAENVHLTAHLTPILDAVVGQARRRLLILISAIAAVLLIACFNLANLSLTRAIGRLRDVAVRLALGATRGRMVTRVLLEHVTLAIIGGTFGLIIARVALVVFVRTAPIDLPRVNEAVLDARVTLFVAIVAIVAGLIVAILPAWRIAGRDVQQALRAGGLATTDAKAGSGARGVLVTLQVALSVTLLVVTGLLLTSFVRLLHSDRGFGTDRVVAIDVALPVNRYTTVASRVPAYDHILEGIRALPGVDAVSLTSALPLSGETQVDVISVDGDTRPMLNRPLANYRFVGPDFFRALSVPISRGRAFTEGDRDLTRGTVPTLVSERAAARAWPGRDPIGQRFKPGGSMKDSYEVIGVVPDARMAAIDGAPPSMVYAPYWQGNRSAMSIVVHAAIEPDALATAVRQAIAQVDPEIAIANVQPMAEFVDAALGGRRYHMWLFVAFGGTALLIATIGVYAVTANGVVRRRREMNIRLALGAQPAQVVGLIVRQGSLPVIGGLIGGAAGAVALGTILASLVFEVRARDPIVISIVLATVGGFGLLACVLAAKQGLEFSAASALREE